VQPLFALGRERIAWLAFEFEVKAIHFGDDVQQLDLSAEERREQADEWKDLLSQC
jgi:hypothetical protein